METMKQYFHGATQKGTYFEGWYLKLQTRAGKALALIPALHIDGNGLHITKLNLDDGQVVLEGEISALFYEDAPEAKGSLFSRMFR